MKEDGTYIRLKFCILKFRINDEMSLHNLICFRLYNTNTTAKTDDDIQERRTSGVGRQGSGGYRGTWADIGFSINILLFFSFYFTFSFLIL